MRKQKITTEDFVTKARKVHGDKYDYSKAEYKTGKSRILIGCPIHGKFFTTPYRHVVQKCGCQRCALKRVSNGNRSTTDKFIAEAKKVHGEKYDYERVKYVSSSNKVKITCKVHGEFSQLPTSHLRGGGCSKCGGSNTCTTLEFITKSKKLHGDIYDYSKVRYIRNKTKVRVGCKTHGSFLVSPNDHLSKKSGCPKCGQGVPTTEEFIAKCRTVHDNRYNYSKVKYTENKDKIIIGCPIHGDFLQRASSHLLDKCECPKCANGRISKKEILFLNELGIPENFRQYSVVGIGQVDGIDPNTKTVYEFLGDYWHGNPKIFDADLMNKTAKKSFGSMCNKTFSRFDKLISRGYTVKYMWENDWKSWIKHKTSTLPLLEYHPT